MSPLDYHNSFLLMFAILILRPTVHPTIDLSEREVRWCHSPVWNFLMVSLTNPCPQSSLTSSPAIIRLAPHTPATVDIHLLFLNFKYTTSSEHLHISSFCLECWSHRFSYVWWLSFRSQLKHHLPRVDFLNLAIF